MSKQILVVDDDELVLVALVELLSPKGYRVSTALGGPQALEKIEKDGFDLLILDIIMPQMDGYQLCQRIRAMERYSEIPIIMLTAKSGEEDKERGLEAGANLFLPKPISPQRLLEMIESTIEKGQSEVSRQESE